MVSKDLLQDIINWDTVNWSRALDFWQKNTTLELRKADVLEIGSCNGGLSLWAALQGANVECTDITPLGPAVKDLHKKYGVSEQIKYNTLDVLHIPYKEKFDIVLLKSVLGGLGLGEIGASQACALQQIFQVLKPGGELFFAENLQASRFHQYCRNRFLHRDKSWRYVTKPEMVDWTDPYFNVRMISYGFVGTFGRNEIQRRFLGTLDQYFLNKLVPSPWHYILVGVAKKPE